MDGKYKLDYPLIAARIKAARKLAGMTQEQFAEKIDISTNAVAKLENNLMTASLQTLINIANVLHMDFNYLLCGESVVERSSLDLYLDGMLHDLSPKEKSFIIHVINGLKLYNVPEP